MDPATLALMLRALPEVTLGAMSLVRAWQQNNAVSDEDLPAVLAAADVEFKKRPPESMTPTPK